MKNKKWIYIVGAIVILAVIGAVFGSGDDDPASSSVPAVAAVSKEDISVKVDSVVDNKYKGDWYYCDVFTLLDGGYSVDLQVMSNVDNAEGEAIAKQLIAAVKALAITDVHKISVTVVDDNLQMVNSSYVDGL